MCLFTDASVVASQWMQCKSNTIIQQCKTKTTKHAKMIKNQIIMAGMAVFNVAGYLIEERRRWPVITASPRGQCSK